MSNPCFTQHQQNQTKIQIEPLTPHEYKLLYRFQQQLKEEGTTEWTSDDFRMLGFDRFLANPDKDIGMLLLKWKWNGFAETTDKWISSTLRTNHGRKIQVWKWTTKP